MTTETIIRTVNVPGIGEINLAELVQAMAKQDKAFVTTFKQQLTESQHDTERAKRERLTAEHNQKWEAGKADFLNRVKEFAEMYDLGKGKLVVEWDFSTEEAIKTTYQYVMRLEAEARRSGRGCLW